MRDPLELFRFEQDTPPAALGAPTLMVALGGFIDAGNAQRLLVSHLLASCEHTVVASFDVDQLIDYRGRRPVMTFDSDHFSAYADPSLLLYRLVDDEGTPFLLLTGPEPDYQWERVIEAVRHLVRVLGVERVVSAHGIPMAVPHTRPVGMTRYANDPDLIPGNAPVFGLVQVPSSLETLLHYRLGEAGYDVIGFGVHVPHYLVQADFADGAVAALEAIRVSTGLKLSIGELAALAEQTRMAIDAQIGESEEVGEVVRGLERQYDAFAEGRRRESLLATELAELPSADEIGAEFEQFLRDADDEA
ncbi:PAC2 family protein [Calidifontibacter sp. DB0510]|uniref:PAC2 family protein n=1 Tax=Metallococcus carri TaxID=1656884 RepID=A0A967B202_9MICO|nr:PAC2 family protein [Metallococcus carri]NHN56053.1 PAC2 family protein [Metallococcus carri]NOP37490.1 PAC2 family protein [Calidifontibacter sp. DB2511S]